MVDDIIMYIDELKQCRELMLSDEKTNLVVLASVTPENRTDFIKVLDLEMRLMGSGNEFSLACRH